MKILLFGVSCVGKTTIGKILAKRIGCEFLDLNKVNIDHYGSIEAFQRAFPYVYERAKEQGKTLRSLVDQDDEDCVIAVTPLNYKIAFNRLLQDEKVIAFEIQDTPKNIFDRLIFTDENDVIMEDSEEYKLEHAAYYMREIKKDITFYKNVYKKIENKVFLDGISAEEGAYIIYKMIINMIQEDV